MASYIFKQLYANQGVIAASPVVLFTVPVGHKYIVKMFKIVVVAGAAASSATVIAHGVQVSAALVATPAANGNVYNLASDQIESTTVGGGLDNLTLEPGDTLQITGAAGVNLGIFVSGIDYTI